MGIKHKRRFLHCESDHVYLVKQAASKNLAKFLALELGLETAPKSSAASQGN